MLTQIKRNSQNPSLTVDSATTGNVTLLPTGNQFWKLNEGTTLTANRTLTLSNTAAKNGDVMYLSIIDVNFGAFNITIKDSGNIMNEIVINSSSTFLFKSNGTRWYRII